MARAHVLRLEVLQLTVDVETVLKSRHCEGTIQNEWRKSDNDLENTISVYVIDSTPYGELVQNLLRDAKDKDALNCANQTFRHTQE